MSKKLLVTGGAGFIGSWFSRVSLQKGYDVVILDKLTYSGTKDNIYDILNNCNFIQGDIGDHKLVEKILSEQKPDAIINFAAESHVDNSIDEPSPFIATNIKGVYNLLNLSKNYFESLSQNKKSSFRFIQISTDEVYGSLEKNDIKFTENSNYQPNSPYSASKAASDHLARAWYETYGLPVIITNCSNNYGPNQHEEKLIPKVINSALRGFEIPIYGNGQNIRDWIYVEDHVNGLLLALEKGKPGAKYLFGGDLEIQNIELVKLICSKLEKQFNKKYSDQIKFVKDRLGHDFRYAIDSSFAKKELGFSINTKFDDGIEKTIDFYLKKNSYL